MKDLQLSAVEARCVFEALGILTFPRRVKEDPDAAPLFSAMAKLREYADSAFCKEKGCERPTYAQGRCEPCYRAAKRRDKRRPIAS